MIEFVKLSSYYFSLRDGKTPVVESSIFTVVDSFPPPPPSIPTIALRHLQLPLACFPFLFRVHASRSIPPIVQSSADNVNQRAEACGTVSCSDAVLP